jgi:hypothetical protein
MNEEKYSDYGFLGLHGVVLYAVTDVSEKDAASIFRVEVVAEVEGRSECACVTTHETTF